MRHLYEIWKFIESQERKLNDIKINAMNVQAATGCKLEYIKTSWMVISFIFLLTFRSERTLSKQLKKQNERKKTMV